jgi:hypothetical protein
MKQLIRSGVCAAIVGVATAGILAQSASTPGQAAPTSQQQAAPSPQTPQAPGPPAPAAQASPDGADRRITVTGCLQPAPPSATGTAGTTTPGTPPNPEAKFLLTNVTKSSASDASAATTPPAAKTYRLVANDAALSPHAGKKLELSGTIDDRDSSASVGRDSSSSANPSSAPKLRVEAGKVLAATCSENSETSERPEK